MPDDSEENSGTFCLFTRSSFEGKCPLPFHSMCKILFLAECLFALELILVVYISTSSLVLMYLVSIYPHLVIIYDRLS